MQYKLLRERLSDTCKKLQEATGEKLEGAPLLEAVEEQMKPLNGEIEKLDETSTIDALRRRTDEIAEVINYLEEEERTEKAEKELPELKKQLEALEAKKAGLTHLEGSLDSIYSIVTQYQKEASLQQIRDLEDLMNKYYSAILGHPYFNRIKIDIEKEEPLQFSFRAASDLEETYIPTKFSTAQLNAAALSIFISNSKLMAGELPLLVLDDPTQNMDSNHIEAFAKLVSSLADVFQVIVATEDDETRDHLKQYYPDATHYELDNWNPTGLQIMSG